MKYSASDLTIDTGTQAVTRDGNTIALSKLSFDLLLVLVRAAPNLVSLDELMRLVWPGVVVSPETVSQRIKLLRDALGDDPREPRYIAGLRGRGYQVIAAVKELESDRASASATVDPRTPDSEPPSPRRDSRRSRLMLIAVSIVTIVAVGWLLADRFWVAQPKPTSTAAAVPVVAEKSIAVLPFVDMSEKKDQEYFADGMSEELINMLTKVPELRVPARTSSFYFKGKQATIADIAKTLGVAHVLEGSVRKSGNTLRITAQLIRVDNGYHAWSQTYDKDIKDLFKIQDEIATAVVSALKVQLTGSAVVSQEHGTTNPEAYNAFLRGRQLYEQGSAAGWRVAIQAFQKAISLDPRYADAYAELALSEYFLSDDTGDPALAKSAEQAAQRAIDLDPQLANGYSVRGILRAYLHFDWAGAEADNRQAVALEPSSSRVLMRYASNLMNVGRLEEAVATYRKAIGLDPLDFAAWVNLGIALTAIGTYPAAFDAFRHALAIRSSQSANYNLAILQLLDGKPRDALATSQVIVGDNFRNAVVAMAEFTLGNAKASQQALDLLATRGAGDSAYQIAEVYAWRGEKDKAFEWLERAYRQQDGGLVSTKIDLPLASLRTDPRYTALLRKLNVSP